MNQRMYINYQASIYYLTSLYEDNMDINLKTSFKNVLHYLHSEVDKYEIPHHDNTLKNFNVRNLSYNELINKTKQTLAIIETLVKDDELVIYIKELLEYVKLLYKKNKMKELEEGMRI